MGHMGWSVKICAIQWRQVMQSEKQKLTDALAVLRVLLGDFTPALFLTLGSGIGYLVELLTDAKHVPYSKIPNCPIPSASGHAGELWWGNLDGVPVVMLRGRSHLYEGLSVHEVVFLTRLMIMLGMKKFIVTHAVGATTFNLEPGDIVAVRSHITLNCPDPTSGFGIAELGIEFPAPQPVFDPRLLQIAKHCALEQQVALHRGVAAFKWGRTFETSADTEAMVRMGADLGTMSTIPEIMAAAQMGAIALDLALVTDMCALPGSKEVVSGDEVLQMIDRMKDPFGRLVRAIVPKMAELAV